MHVKRRLILFVSAAIAAVTGPLQASGQSDFRVSGYGTLALTHDTRSGSAFIRELTQRPAGTDGTELAPRTRPWLSDSRLGVQALYRVNPTVELMAQLSIRDQETVDPDNALEWAFVGVHPEPDLHLRLGRVGYDAFLMSDYRQLGYAYPWVRPPVEFYGWLPVYSLNGADIAYRIDDADGTGTWRVKAQLGNSGTDFPFGAASYEFDSDILGLTLTRESGPWRLRAGYSRIDIQSEAPLGELHAGLDTIAAQGIPGISAEAADLRRNMSYDGATIRYYALGAAYNDGRWLLQGELGLADTSADMVSNGAMAYLSLGRHLGDWTPYAVLSRVESHHAPRGARTDWGTIGQAAFQELALGAHNSTRFEQTGLSLGLRWDPLPQSAVKLQWDRYFVGSDGYGLWWTSESRDEQREIDVFTLSTEFIF